MQDCSHTPHSARLIDQSETHSSTFYSFDLPLTACTCLQCCAASCLTSQIVSPQGAEGHPPRTLLTLAIWSEDWLAVSLQHGMSLRASDASTKPCLYFISCGLSRRKQKKSDITRTFLEYIIVILLFGEAQQLFQEFRYENVKILQMFTCVDRYRSVPSMWKFWCERRESWQISRFSVYGTLLAASLEVQCHCRHVLRESFR